MFFIGVFGIDRKEKEIKIIDNLNCKNCSISNKSRLIKTYDFFHFFFIPVFKWNENYYVICDGCNSIYSISREKGKTIESGEDIEIRYWDLNEVNNRAENYYSIKRCSKCNKELDTSFGYCPYCGEKLK